MFDVCFPQHRTNEKSQSETAENYVLCGMKVDVVCGKNWQTELCLSIRPSSQSSSPLFHYALQKLTMHNETTRCGFRRLSWSYVVVDALDNNRSRAVVVKSFDQLLEDQKETLCGGIFFDMCGIMYEQTREPRIYIQRCATNKNSWTFKDCKKTAFI